MTRWKIGDFCRVNGDGLAVFIVKDMIGESAMLYGLNGHVHGRESFTKMTRVTKKEARKLASRLRAQADILDPPYKKILDILV